MRRSMWVDSVRVSGLVICGIDARSSWLLMLVSSDFRETVFGTGAVRGNNIFSGVPASSDSSSLITAGFDIHSKLSWS